MYIFFVVEYFLSKFNKLYKENRWWSPLKQSMLVSWNVSYGYVIKRSCERPLTGTRMLKPTKHFVATCISLF